MAIDRIKHTKPASQRTFLDELEPIPYEISEEEIAQMDPRMRKILFGAGETAEADAEAVIDDEPETPDEDPDAIAPPAIKQQDEEDVYGADDEEEIDEPNATRLPEHLAIEPPKGFDPYSLASDFPEAPLPNITLIFPATPEEEDAVEAARAAQRYEERTVEGQRWIAARFTQAEATSLIDLNERLHPLKKAWVLFNGSPVPLGRSLWARLMYLFAARRM